MRRLTITLISLLSLTACNGAVDPSTDAQGGLGDAEYQQILDINTTLENGNRAWMAALAAFTGSATSDLSWAKMAQSLKANCEFVGEMPGNDLTGGTHTQTIQGAECPVYWSRSRGLNPAKTTLVLNENLQVRDDNYVIMSGLSARASLGALQRDSTATGKRVYGSWWFEQLKTVAHGEIDVRITTDATYPSALSGSGFVEVRLSSATMAPQTARIDWQVDGTPAFTVNGNAVSEKTTF